MGKKVQEIQSRRALRSKGFFASVFFVRAKGKVFLGKLFGCIAIYLIYQDVFFGLQCLCEEINQVWMPSSVTLKDDLHELACDVGQEHRASQEKKQGVRKLEN